MARGGGPRRDARGGSSGGGGGGSSGRGKGKSKGREETVTDLGTLAQLIPPLFDQAQSSTANHRRNAIALYQIYINAADVIEHLPPKESDDDDEDEGEGEEQQRIKLVGEKQFMDLFLDMLNRVLVVKKAVVSADRIGKWVGTFVAHLSQKAAEKVQEEEGGQDDDEEEEEEDTPLTRFVSRLLSYLLKGFIAKNKNVRFRAISFVTEIISHLGELDQDVYVRLRSALIERTRDKEAPIRAHAVLALSSLLSGEDGEPQEEILGVLLDCVQYDIAPEVRKTALLHTPLVPSTLATILTRTRDVDPFIRTILYAHTLLPPPPPPPPPPSHNNNNNKAKNQSDKDTSTSASTSRAATSTQAQSRTSTTTKSHNRLPSPTYLTISQREKIVRDGLGDREKRVRAGVGKMLGGWFDGCRCRCRCRLGVTRGGRLVGGEGERDDKGEEEEEEEEANELVESLVEFLGLFDLVGEAGLRGPIDEYTYGVYGEEGEEGGREMVAADALRSLFVTRPEVVEGIMFSDEYWRTLTPPTALLARVFISYHHQPNVQQFPSHNNNNHDGVDDEHGTMEVTRTRLLESAHVPVLTAFAFYLQKTCNDMFDAVDEVEQRKWRRMSRRSNAYAYEDEDEEDEEEEDKEMEKLEEKLAEKVFVLGETLKILAGLDYSDEVGRRKVFSVVREILAHEDFPEPLLDLCLQVLKETTPDEREMIRIGVEIVGELREKGFPISGGDDDDDDNDGGEGNGESGEYDGGEESRTSDRRRSRPNQSQIRSRTNQDKPMTVEEQARMDVIDARCLSICVGLLKRVDGRFDENSTLEGVLAELIVPSLKRRERMLRERGLLGLGLCCLISKPMALSSFQLFLNQVQPSSTNNNNSNNNAPPPPESLKLKVWQVVFDVLMVYAEDLLMRNQDIANRIVASLLQILETEESNAIQAVLCVGISKLMLNGLVTDDRVLTSLVLAYVSPATADNQELRQCLAYFLPVYCYSSTANRDRMRSVFVTAYRLVSQAYTEMQAEKRQNPNDQDAVEDDSPENGPQGTGTMITPLQFGTLFVDWTNPLKAVPTDGGRVGRGHGEGKETHVDLAIDIIGTMILDEEEDEGEGDEEDQKTWSTADTKVLTQLLTKLYFPPDPSPLALAALGAVIDKLDDKMRDRELDVDPTTQKTFVRFKTRFEKQLGRQLERVRADLGRHVAEVEGKKNKNKKDEDEDERSCYYLEVLRMTGEVERGGEEEEDGEQDGEDREGEGRDRSSGGILRTRGKEREHDEDEGGGEEEEEEEDANDSPLPNGHDNKRPRSRSVPASRFSRQRLRSRSTSESESISRSPTPTPRRKKPRQSAPELSSPPSSTRSHSHSPSLPVSSHTRDNDIGEYDRERSPPETSLRDSDRARKRTRSPTKHPSITPSPAPKRVNKSSTPM